MSGSSATTGAPDLLARTIFNLLSENRSAAARLFRALAARERNPDRHELFLDLGNGAASRAKQYKMRSQMSSASASFFREALEKFTILQEMRATLGAIDRLDRDDARLHTLLVRVLRREIVAREDFAARSKLRLVR